MAVTRALPGLRCHPAPAIDGACQRALCFWSCAPMGNGKPYPYKRALGRFARSGWRSASRKSHHVPVELAATCFRVVAAASLRCAKMAAMLTRSLFGLGLTIALGACSRSASLEVGTGGCLVVKQAPTGEYAYAQFEHFVGDQAESCQHVVDQWNADTYLTGTSARFRCQCPPP